VFFFLMAPVVIKGLSHWGVSVCAAKFVTDFGKRSVHGFEKKKRIKIDYAVLFQYWHVLRGQDDTRL